MTSKLAGLEFVVSAPVPTFKVVVTFGHLKLIFTVWPSQQGPRALRGDTEPLAYKSECSVDKHFKTALHHAKELSGLFNVRYLT